MTAAPGPRRWRKKPVVVEAMRYDGTPESGASIVEWSGGAVRQGKAGTFVFLKVLTLEGAMKAEVGDWIIKGVKGEFYPCKPDILEMTYVPADVPERGDVAILRSALEAVVQLLTKPKTNSIRDVGRVVGAIGIARAALAATEGSE